MARSSAPLLRQLGQREHRGDELEVGDGIEPRPDGVGEVIACPARATGSIASPAAISPGSSTRRCRPVSRVRRAWRTRSGIASRAATLKHGERGWETCTSAVPIRQTSPIRASVSSTPSDVMFSPKAGATWAAQCG